MKEHYKSIADHLIKHARIYQMFPEYSRLHGINFVREASSLSVEYRNKSKELEND